MFKTALLASIMAILALTGCRATIDVDRDAGTVTVSVTEADMNDAIIEALNETTNPLLRDPSVDLQDGVLVVNGQHQRRDGSDETVSGSITLSFSTLEGRLQVEVVSVVIDGLPSDDPRLIEFVSRFADRLNQRLTRSMRRFNIDTISITDDDLTIVLKNR
jgi:hypothetical protein